MDPIRDIGLTPNELQQDRHAADPVGVVGVSHSRAPEPPARTWAPYVLPLAGVVLSAGVALAQSRETGAESDRLRVKLDAHIAADTSAVIAERVHAIEADRAAMETEIHEMRELVLRIDRNLVAVCTSTPRAQCVR